MVVFQKVASRRHTKCFQSNYNSFILTIHTKGRAYMREPKILIVEDEIDLANLLTVTLRKEGLTQTLATHTLQTAEKAFHDYNPDLVLLDVMLPDGEGYELCKVIRQTSHIPILFMSAKTEEVDKLVGLAIGGDDYISKPFSPKEVAYRVKAQLRRAEYTTPAATWITVGDFKMNQDETEIYLNDALLELTAKEVGLMAAFMRNPNRILSKESLFERVWGEDYFGADNTMMVHIRRLREKIENDPSRPTHIITVKGLGYKFIA